MFLISYISQGIPRLMTRRDSTLGLLFGLGLEWATITLYQVDILIKHFRNLMRKFRKPQIAQWVNTFRAGSFYKSLYQSVNGQPRQIEPHLFGLFIILASSNPCRIRPVKAVLK